MLLGKTKDSFVILRIKIVSTGMEPPPIDGSYVDSINIFLNGYCKLFCTEVQIFTLHLVVANSPCFS